MKRFERRALIIGQVLLVAPRLSYPFEVSDEIPPEVPQLCWEDTARIVGGYAQEQGDPVGRFLANELSNYFLEEGLVDPEMLTREHIEALNNRRAAEQSLMALCKAAARLVMAQWNDCTSEDHYPKTHNPKERWWLYQPYKQDEAPRTLPPDAFWGWSLLYDEQYVFKDGDVGKPCFAAGMNREPGTIAALIKGREDRLKQLGFDVLRAGDSNSEKYAYVWCRKGLESDAVAGSTLQQQAASLASWITDTFEGLATTLDDSQRA